MTITKLIPTIEAIWGYERKRKADGTESENSPVKSATRPADKYAPEKQKIKRV